ncbi:MAG: MFS transporter [Pirellulales bacterium]
MPPNQRQPGRLRADAIRQAMWFANANAGLWAVGNGLVSTLLVIYLAADLGAQGLAISLILAAPRFAGVLRLGVPALIAQLKNRKGVCISAYVVSAVVLCIVPAAAVMDRRSADIAVSTLVVAWCVYHLAEYVGTVALWSWLGDVTPRRIRGRLLGRREQWLIAGRIGGLVMSAALAELWESQLPGMTRWVPLALSAAAGALLMLVAVVPLVNMPAVRHAPSAVPRAPWRTLGHVFIDPAYRRLLLFSCWFSVVNGLAAAAQEVYPIRVLDLRYGVRQVLQGAMRTGQLAIAPWMGQLVDRWGNRPVMVVTQLVAATGSLFFLAATPERPWLVAGAFAVWVAYAGLNIGLDNIKLKLAAEDNNAPYIAAYYALSDLTNGLAIVAGGMLVERLADNGSEAMRLYAQLFLLAWIGRTLAALLAARLIEPGARRLRDLF